MWVIIVKFIEYIDKQEIKDEYKIISVEELTGGLINKIYKITTVDGIYVAKVLNELNTNNINKYELSEEISNICNDNDINVCGAIKIKDRYVQKIGEDYVILFNYLSGYSLSVHDISNINYEKLLYANLLIRFDFLYYNLDITLVNKTENLEEYTRASDEVINMINEINYYMDNIDKLISYLNKLN